jgi:hypothetical protein
VRYQGRTVDQTDTEYRVQYRRPGQEWQTLVTNRGGGRPFFTLGAAKGVLTQARTAEEETRVMRNTVAGREGKPTVAKTEWRIQSRPVEDNWTDVADHPGA